MTTTAEVDVVPSTRPGAAGAVCAGPKATTGFWSWFTTVDHKKIGILYGGTALIFFVIGGIEALLIRLQLAQPNGTLLTAAQYNQLFTMHGTTMVFLVGMPLAVGVRATTSIPLQIGARDVAFPRLNMFGYWVVLARRPLHLLELLPRRRAERRLVRLHAAARARRSSLGALPGHGPDFWTVGLDHARHRLDDVGDQLHRHDPQHARAGHDAHAHAGVHVDDARGRVPHRCSRCRSSPSR